MYVTTDRGIGQGDHLEDVERLTIALKEGRVVVRIADFEDEALIVTCIGGRLNIQPTGVSQVMLEVVKD